MGKCFQKSVALLLSLSILICIIAISPIAVSAFSVPDENGFANKIEELKKTYHGTYSGTYYENGAAKAWQCHGYAWQIAMDVFGSTTYSPEDNGWGTFSSLGEVYAGDVIQFYISSGTHTIFVTKVDGDEIYFTDANWDWNNGIRWDAHLSYSYINSRFCQKYNIWGNYLKGTGSSYIDLGTDFYAFIMNKRKWKPLTVEQDENVVIRGEKTDHCVDQVWKFERQYDGSYKIISTANGKVLDVDEKSLNVSVWEDWGGNNQRWYIYGNKDTREFVLKAKCTEYVLDVYGNHSDDGTNVQIYSRHNGESEIFDFYILYNRSFAANLGNDFTAPILNQKSWITLQNDENSNVSLQQETGTARDLWRFKRQSDGSYIICSCYDGKCFDLQNWSHDNGANVQVYDETGCDAQRWYLYEYAGGYTIQSKESGKLLDVADGVLSVGSNIQVHAWNGSDAQIFSVYRGDECKLTPVNLAVSIKDNHQVEFAWSNVYGEKGFDIKIWNGKHWVGDAYTNIWALPANSTSATTELPPGKYEAYIDTYNNYDLLMSNVVSFEVLPQFLISVYHKEHILKCTWDKVLQAESYKIEIFDSSSNLVLSKENIKDLQYQTPISEGSYTVKITSDNNISVTKPLIVNFIEGKIGDVNLDGYINVDDGWFYVKALVGNVSFPNKTIADANMDGKTSITDTRLILRYISGKEEEKVGKTILLNMIGDTNLDGHISIGDVTAIQRHIADLNTFNAEQLSVADTNGDGNITIDDATHLQLYLAEYDVVLGKQ